MKIRVQVLLEHGILFLYDPYGDAEIPSDTGAAPITFTDSCVCFQVAAYVDGDVDVTMSDQAFAEPVSPTFSGRIKATTGHISLTDVPGNYYCILRTKTDYADIDIWNYEQDGIDMSWIRVQEIDLF